MKKLLQILELIVNILGAVVMSGLITLMYLSMIFMLFTNPQGLMPQISLWFRILMFVFMNAFWVITCSAVFKSKWIYGR